MTDIAPTPNSLLLDSKQAGQSAHRYRLGPEEDLLTLTQATRLLPKIGGRKVAVSTLWRWCTKGLRGVRLQYVRVGRKICTTREFLLQFFSELAELDERVPLDTRYQPRILKRRVITSRERERALAEADKVLAKAKI